MLADLVNIDAAKPHIERWLAAQRLEHAALIALDRTERFRGGIAHRARRCIDTFCTQAGSKVRAWNALPLRVLAKLQQLADATDLSQPQSLLDARESIKSTLSALTTSSGGSSMCATRLVENIVQLVLYSNWGAEQICRLAGSAPWMQSVRHNWHSLPGDWDAHLNRLRRAAAEGDTDGGVTTLSMLVQLHPLFVVQGHPKFDWLADRIADALLDSQLAWPLLVIDLDGNAPASPGVLAQAPERRAAEHAKSVAVALPVGVEVAERLRDDEAGIRFVSDDAVVTPRWRDSAPVILDRAVALYRNLRPGGRSEWRRPVATLDFSLAVAAAEGLGGLVLEDRSMEAYFAITILSRLLKQPSTPRTLVTGSIERSEDGRDRIGNVQGIPAKLAAAFGSGLSDRVVVPKEAEVDLAIAQAMVRQTASVIPVRHLDSAAEIAIGAPCRGAKFVRCDELLLQADGMHGDAARRVADAMAVSPHAIVDLGNANGTAGLTGADVLEWLRTRGLADDCLFVRVHPDEDDESLWEMTGEALGASPFTIAEILAARLPAEVAAGVASMLRVRPDVPRTRTLVIVGGSQRVAAFAAEPMPSNRTHALAAVLEPLQEELRSVAHSLRVVLVNDVPPGEVAAAAPDEPTWLDSLRVFRGSFEQLSAAAVLGASDESARLRGTSLHQELHSAVDNGHLVRTPLGEYMVVRSRGAPLSDAAEETMEMHWRASQAYLSNFAMNQRKVGLSFDRSRQVCNVLEGEYHLRQVEAAYARSNLRTSPTRERAEQRLAAVRRIGRRHRRGALARTATFGDEDWGEHELRRIERAITDDAARGLHVHPMCLVGAGIAAYNAINNQAGDALALIGRALAVFKAGFASCDALPPPERQYAVVWFTSRVDCLMMRLVHEAYGPSTFKKRSEFFEQQKDRLRPVVQDFFETVVQTRNRQSVALVHSGVVNAGAALAEWCDRRALEELDAARAMTLAVHTCLAPGTLDSSWVILLGACRRAQQDANADADAKATLHAALGRLLGDSAMRARLSRVSNSDWISRHRAWTGATVMAGALERLRPDTRTPWLVEGLQALKDLSSPGGELSKSAIKREMARTAPPGAN